MQELNSNKQRMNELATDKATLESEIRNTKEMYSEDDLKKMRQNLEDGNFVY